MKFEYAIKKDEKFTSATNITVAKQNVNIFIMNKATFEQEVSQSDRDELAYKLYKIRTQDVARRELTAELIKRAIEAGLA